MGHFIIQWLGPCDFKLFQNISLIATEVYQFEEAKFVVVARTRSEDIIVDKPGLTHQSSVDKKVKFVIPRDTFERPTKVRIQVRETEDFTRVIMPLNLLNELRKIRCVRLCRRSLSFFSDTILINSIISEYGYKILIQDSVYHNCNVMTKNLHLICNFAENVIFRYEYTHRINVKGVTTLWYECMYIICIIFTLANVFPSMNSY